MFSFISAVGVGDRLGRTWVERGSQIVTEKLPETNRGLYVASILSLILIFLWVLRKKGGLDARASESALATYPLISYQGDIEVSTHDVLVGTCLLVLSYTRASSSLVCASKFVITKY